MRTVPRRRRYVGELWLSLLTPFFRYSFSRDAYVLRGIGGRVGPVLRRNRRSHRRHRFRGPERRRASAA